MTSVPIFRWFEISGGASCIPGSSLLKGPAGFPLHAHDFHEVFWVKSGRGVHTINGREQPLSRGMVVWIRPSDCHSFQSDMRGVWVYNVAVGPGLWERLRKLFFPFDDHFWGGPLENQPLHQTLGNAQLRTMCGWFDEFVASPHDDFHGLRLMMNLLHVSERVPRAPESGENGRWDAVPGWLADALRTFRRRPDHLAGGTRALAALAGRSPEHVSRTLRQATGWTPRAWVTRQRLQHAATQIITTNRKILDISMECGFESLGHFHRLFTQHYGMPPGKYRRQRPSRPI